MLLLTESPPLMLLITYFEVLDMHADHNKIEFSYFRQVQGCSSEDRKAKLMICFIGIYVAMVVSTSPISIKHSGSIPRNACVACET